VTNRQACAGSCLARKRAVRCRAATCSGSTAARATVVLTKKRQCLKYGSGIERAKVGGGWWKVGGGGVGGGRWRLDGEGIIARRDYVDTRPDKSRDLLTRII